MFAARAISRTQSSFRSGLYSGCIPLPRRHVTTTASESAWHTRWVLWRQKPLLQRIGFALRIVRIPVVAAGIFSLGYHQGVIESQRNPILFQEQLLESVLTDTGATEFEVVSETDLQGRAGKRLVTTSRNHQVAHVAQQLVQKATLHIESQLAEAKEKEDKKGIELWEAAQLRFGGGQGSFGTDPWRFVFVNSNDPNAWVAEILPRRIFITTALLDMAQTVDEVAFVLGHELSHLVLGHSSRHNDLRTTLKTVEIVLLSLDPTEGLLAFAVILLLDFCRKCAEASYSRDHEHEADDLGLELVASCGCFELQAGSRFMHRLHQMVSVDCGPIESASDTHTMIQEETSLMGWLDSHPASLERARFLFQKSKELEK